MTPLTDLYAHAPVLVSAASRVTDALTIAIMAALFAGELDLKNTTRSWMVGAKCRQSVHVTSQRTRMACDDDEICWSCFHSLAETLMGRTIRFIDSPTGDVLEQVIV